MLFKNNLLILLLLIFISNCSEKTYITGNIFNENIDYNKFKNKEELINNLGNPNFKDLIENKYYYYSEINKRTNAFNEKLISRIIYVYKFEGEAIISINKYDINDQNEFKISKQQTENNLIETGIIKKIFGGVSPSNRTNTSN